MVRTKKRRMRVALAAWEIGRVASGLGAKVGGLGVIVEELPAELKKAAARMGIELDLEILCPCFAHYDRSRLKKLNLKIPVEIEGTSFNFEAYTHTFKDGQRVVYFWDPGQLHWTHASSIYPDDPQVGLKIFAAVSQAMAAYVAAQDFDTIHLHDYHVGLLPFYLEHKHDISLPCHLTIHNATYQGITPLLGGGYSSLDRIGLPGDPLFHRYFDFFNNLNMMKAAMLKVHESGGRITTVSGDLDGSWGYAAELRESHTQLWSRAYFQKGGPPGEVFVPNRHLELFEKLPVAGITNGLADANRPEQLAELRADKLQAAQSGQKDQPIFRNPKVQKSMLASDHDFDAKRLEVKAELKSLLHLECFGSEPTDDPILLTAVGRLVAQKNLGLVAEVAERCLAHDPGAKLIVLASAPAGERHLEDPFWDLAARHPDRVYFNNAFNLPLSKLILAGGDFCLIPSRFEPCGLVDYEASLLGNVVIARATGGLTKVRHCAYLYDWLDLSDEAGEADAFFQQIMTAMDTYRHAADWHEDLKRKAMAIDASWDRSAEQYIDLYQFGQANLAWQQRRQDLLKKQIAALGKDKTLFTDFFRPALEEYSDTLDWQLKTELDKFV
ncbi:MAG: glycogen/starch synthase [Deltaproteobacteria bacterium]|nr:glycogen/starch synthase [Deltaproteobacteria bacterium]